MHRLLRAAITGLIAVVAPPTAFGQTDDAVARGEYIFHAAGCAGCHTDKKNEGQLLAGGRGIDTPFGTFFGPNITAHPEHGIGTWTDEDFIRALREGKSPGGSHYYPAFPYTSFTKMTDADMRDLRAYIFSLPVSDQPNQPHDLGFPFSIRALLGGWKMANFDAGEFAPDPAVPDEVNRGAYLVEALTHCAECHTPRTRLGGLDQDMFLGGTDDGPEGESTGNLTPHETGLGGWSDGDILFMLRTGILPNGDVVGSLMSEVIDGTSKLTEADQRAIIAYLRSLPAIDNQIGEPSTGGGDVF